MLKILSLTLAFTLSSFAYAECEISEALKDKVCGSEYFFAKDIKQLNEYLLFGKFNNGKLLNLEIGFDIKEKEINIGTSCDIRLKQDAVIRTTQNGICLQGNNIFTRKQSSILADKKAPITLIANNSIKIRKTRIQTAGEVEIIAKSFDPFANEVLISKGSNIASEKLTISTPSSLIINNDSRIKSSIVILNGGNCEVGDNNDQDNDDDRNSESLSKKFNPKLFYSGTCLNNPITTNLKISSIADEANSLKMTYTLLGSSSDLFINWEFDNTFRSANETTIQKYIFPGRHLSVAVVSNSSGFFRKIGAYQNVSPTKFNIGQLAIFQFNGLKDGPPKIIALMGLKKITLIKSEQDPKIYSGEIPEDPAGKKLIAIPEFSYKGSFNLAVLPTINNPSEYINSFVNSVGLSLEELNQDDQAKNELTKSLSSILSELRSKISSLPAKDQAVLAARLQANIEVSSNVAKSSNLNFKINLLNLLIPTANAFSLSFADKFIPARMREYTASDIIEIGAGVTWVTTGILLLKTPGTFYGADKLAGIGLIALGVGTILKYHQKKNKIIIDLYDFIGNIASFDAAAGEVHTIRFSGSFIPVKSDTKNALTIKSLNLTNDYNYLVTPFNETFSSINTLLRSLGLSNYLIGSLPTLSFPTNSFQSSLSSDFIMDVQLLRSDYGDVSIKSVNKLEDGVNIQFNSTRSQNATVRVFYKNDGFNLHVYKDVIVKVAVLPKANINFFRKNLDFEFYAGDPKKPRPTGLTYLWDFGDGQSATTQDAFHSYSLPGLYKVTLTVTGPHGGSSTSKIDVNAVKPSINYNPPKDLQVQFFSSELEAPGKVFIWHFGDNTAPVETSTRSFLYTYKNPGTYTVFVETRDTLQNETEAYADVTVNNPIVLPPVEPPPPGRVLNADFNYSAPQLEVSFSAAMATINDLTYTWDFGDETSEESENYSTSHTYQSGGYYPVTLKVSDKIGNETSLTKKILVMGLPPSLTNTTAGRNVNFKLSDSFVVDGTTLYYLWDFADGTTLKTSLKAITHSFPDLLSREVKVKLMDENANIIYQLSNNLSDRTYSDLVSYISNRDVRFRLDSALTFENVSLNYVWKFGDGQTSTTNSSEVIHRYNNEGTYTAEVKVYDSLGVLLYNNKSIILADQTTRSFAGMGKIDENGNTVSYTEQEYLEAIAQYLSPTTKTGFIYEVYMSRDNDTCYSKGLDYFYSDDGVRYVYMPLYNCTSNDLLPTDSTPIDTTIAQFP